MPNLAAPPHIFPENLLDGELNGHCTGTDRSWWAFYTRPRQEKCLAKDLLHREIGFYLPLVKRRVLVRNRPTFSMVPLFPGYVFVFASPDERVRGLKTNRVAQVIAAKDREQMQNDLRNVAALIQAGAPLTVEARLTPGQSVRVKRGPLMGLEGTLLRRKNETRLVVAINLLQQGVSLEIEDYLLEPM